ASAVGASTPAVSTRIVFAGTASGFRTTAVPGAALPSGSPLDDGGSSVLPPLHASTVAKSAGSVTKGRRKRVVRCMAAAQSNAGPCVHAITDPSRFARLLALNDHS